MGRREKGVAEGLKMTFEAILESIKTPGVQLISSVWRTEEFCGFSTPVVTQLWSRDKSAIPGLLHCGLSCPSPRTGHAPLSASSSPSDTSSCTLGEESEGSLLLGDLQAVHTSALPLSSLRTT